MKNKGIHQHRFETNPRERIFAEEWEKINTLSPIDAQGVGQLVWLLATEMYPTSVSTQTQIECATLIQWLGSPAGQGFLQTVNERIAKERV